jgi:2-polyprenyl-6-methoxyphenol hydroxylase-like FAD-dependent oxidoreductase
MKILIVGAGIGGLTLAALLRRDGHALLVVERAPDLAHAGYMLGLYPLGSRVLHGLGQFGTFMARSDPMDRYLVADGHGRELHGYDLSTIAERVGPIRQIGRGTLLALLREAAPKVELRFGTTVAGLEQSAGAVAVTLSDGSAGSFDLVVGADGLHSRLRETHVGAAESFRTGWGAWVWWADPALAPHDSVQEYWGAGRLVGAYPTPEAIGVIAAGPLDEIGPEAGIASAEALRVRFGELARTRAPLFDALPVDLSSLFFWRLEDSRAAHWCRGRLALLGDAACGFLPTAGIGASMAMESAAVLADELRRCDADGVPRALTLYEKRRRGRAEAAQEDSRKLARMMFLSSQPMAWARDQLLKVYSLEMLAKQIVKSLEEPI